ncbi:YeiH family protein [Pseudobacter ginsenosidimutans]|uniref:Putative integral membrane protein (TIGR00698 family) n=1 Tax=Pseudobacter ginsenosidimutans TaxID=661488 RepID=A0A4Q7MS58_9BACT|nr:putative sulfate exporter family transporter [Pseudobacter ginsenosidimutans]QEC42449.1 putative sulfate exporter family transporter [Pseudobacter ginsenosidimutans]RZS70699.1 putative integral membrane protein (TIGR00698 family) [Pseudobacter ginsenosidimutans]
MDRTRPVPGRKFLDMQFSAREIIFIIIAVLCCTNLISAPVALLLGLLVAQLVGHPWLHLNHKVTHWLLQISVVGLGFGMNAHAAIEAGRAGFGITVVSIVATLGIGLLLGRWMRIDKKTACLIATGTAICGGSAIAAVAPAIDAKDKQISVALGTVFILNAVALFIFPVTGHLLGLSQMQFGTWAAIAIHDTSSVVGAGSRYGPQALEVATTVKLARALWIIPVSIIASFAFRKKGQKIQIPWFIGLFILAMLGNTFIPAVQTFSPYATIIAKAGLTLTLFLIGSGLSRDVLRSVGIRPMVQGLITWASIAAATLWFIYYFV